MLLTGIFKLFMLVLQVPVDFGFLVCGCKTTFLYIIFQKKFTHGSLPAALYLPNQWRIKFCTFSSRTSHFTHLSETYRYLGAGRHYQRKSALCDTHNIYCRMLCARYTRNTEHQRRRRWEQCGIKNSAFFIFLSLSVAAAPGRSLFLRIYLVPFCKGKSRIFSDT